jgi:hypothetical protein
MKKLEKGEGQMMMSTHCMSNYYLCYFLEIIDNEKIRGNWWGRWWCVHTPRDMLRNYSGLGRWCDTWWCVYAACQENCI